MKWGKTKVIEKKAYLQNFSKENWDKLSQRAKSEHTFKDCKKCFYQFHDFQGMMPVFKGFESKAKENLLLEAELKTFRDKNKNISKKRLKDVANKIHTTIEGKFSKVYGHSYTDTLTEIKSLKLQRRPTKYEAEKNLLNTQRKIKNNMEVDINKTAVVRQTFSFFLALFFIFKELNKNLSVLFSFYNLYNQYLYFLQWSHLV